MLPGDQKKKTILFLLNDTDPVLLRVIKNKFKKDAGWESIITTNYRDALRLIAEQSLDGIMTEILINDDTGKTGFDLIAEVKKNSRNSSVPIIVFTELNQDEDRQKAERLGATCYFVKTRITLNTLIEAIKAIV